MAFDGTWMIVDGGSCWGVCLRWAVIAVLKSDARRAMSVAESCERPASAASSSWTAR
jgi:hypothetical protein